MGSAFVEGRVGENNNNSVWGGLKLYFGPTDKSLVARHRRDDPGNYTTDMATSTVNGKTPTSTGSSSLKSCPLGVKAGDEVITNALEFSSEVAEKKE